VISIIIAAPSALAQYGAQLSPAATVLKGQSKGGAYIGIYDGAFGVLGQYRIGIGGYSDLGFKMGVIDLDSNSPQGDVGLSLAVDTKYQIMEVRIMDPVDLSVGGVLEFVKFNHYNNFVFGGSAVGSYPVELKSGRLLVPYSRLIIGFNRSDPDWGGSDTDFNLGLNLGSTLELSTSTEAVAEFQIDNDAAAFLMGLSFGF
jgi:hypothetical protein